ncbi:uncharacterized protein LOC117282748 isoform X2 [Cryptotermes secundus]|uniref:uncharacterized protein LOC117282748 isoform X2 n=1 Tax=Cryptotermes secundus TaxID=105785 RepID=UPI001454C934|nr:uncharacterized protein LOC117282748 isoform X2 [Cryptotermes secundus]
MAVCVVDVGKEVRRNEFCFRILPSTYHVYTQNWSYSFSTKGTHHLMLLKKSCHLLVNQWRCCRTPCMRDQPIARPLPIHRPTQTQSSMP